jgi:hypothetical protein
MMEAASTSEMSVSATRLHEATIQKKAIFKFTLFRPQQMVQIASTGLQTYVYTSYLVKKHEVD